MTKSVAEVMTLDPRVVWGTAAVIEAAKIILDDVCSLPVVNDDGELVCR